MSHKYDPIGKCIYCKRTTVSLSDEHIVPLAFGGDLILPKSSCMDCAERINSQIEQPILRSDWGNFRIKHECPTRNKNKVRPSNVELCKPDGFPMEIPIREYSTIVPLYDFNEARIWSRVPARENDFTMSVLASSNEEVAMQSTRYAEWDQAHRFVAKPYSFARWIAKIGYGYAIAELGDRTFVPIVTNTILGDSEDVFALVGGARSPHTGSLSGTYKLKTSFQIKVLVRRCGMRLVGLLIVRVQLLEPLAIPSYHAVVGIIDYANPQDRQEFERYFVQRAGGNSSRGRSVTLLKRPCEVPRTPCRHTISPSRSLVEALRPNVPGRGKQYRNATLASRRQARLVSSHT